MYPSDQCRFRSSVEEKNCKCRKMACLLLRFQRLQNVLLMIGSEHSEMNISNTHILRTRFLCRQRSKSRGFVLQLDMWVFALHVDVELYVILPASVHMCIRQTVTVIELWRFNLLWDVISQHIEKKNYRFCVEVTWFYDQPSTLNIQIKKCGLKLWKWYACNGPSGKLFNTTLFDEIIKNTKVLCICAHWSGYIVI